MQNNRKPTLKNEGGHIFVVRSIKIAPTKVRAK